MAAKRQVKGMHNAATKLQASFRKFAARRQFRGMKKAACKIQAGFRGKQSRDIIKQYKTAVNLDFTDDSSDDSDEDDDDVFDAEAVEEYAATKIQAGVRGMQARKSVKSLRESLTETPEPPADIPANAASEATTDVPGGGNLTNVSTIFLRIIYL